MRQRRDLLRLSCAAHALDLDRVRGLAQSRRIHQCDGQSADVHPLREEIARRSRHVRHDRARGADERVEQARLARVRPAGDDHQAAVAHDAAGAAFTNQRFERGLHLAQLAGGLLARDEMKSFLGEVERRLEPRREIEHARVDRPESPW